MANEKRLIDVWDLIEWLDNFDRENTLRILRGKKAKLLNSHAIKNMIVTVPTVDAVEVVHGRWVRKAHDGAFGVFHLWHCSVCDTIRARQDPYCGECGAKMEIDNG